MLTALALTTLVAAACTSSSKRASTTSNASVNASSSVASQPSGASTAGLSFEVSGDLSGTTDALSTKVSQCTSVNGQFFFEGTVSLGGAELDVKLSMAPVASVEIADLAGGRTWAAPSDRDPAATISMKPESATSGSFTASAVLVDAGDVELPSDVPLPRLDVRGTYRC